MKAKSLRQSVTFRASPHEIYEALMDQKKHMAFSGEKARISRKVGGKIEAYGGYIQGVNLALVKDRKIVQSWRGSDWEADQVSTVTFALSRVKGGTRLSFLQTGVPEAVLQDIRQGWKDYYWARMKAYLEA